MYHLKITLMRAILTLSLVFLTLTSTSLTVSAQSSTTHSITLYAHSTGTSLTISALPSWGGLKTANITGGLAFKLSQPLGRDMLINGAITMTVYLYASTVVFGDIALQLSELLPSGEDKPVLGAVIETPIRVDKRILPYTFGVGIISHTFHGGSLIVLHVKMEPLTAGTPFLAYDSADVPTSTTIPVESPLQFAVAFRSNNLHYGKIIGLNGTQRTARVDFVVNVTDVIGAYRLGDAALTLTAGNGSAFSVQPSKRVVLTVYTLTYSFSSSVAIGTWGLDVYLRDNQGNQYAFGDKFLVTPIYEAKINVVDASSVPLSNAMVTAEFASTESLSNLTDTTGWTTMFLPSSLVVGPLYLSIAWKGVQTPPRPIIMFGEATVFLKLPIYSPQLRLTIYGVPVSGADILLKSGNKTIARTSSGFDGTASFSRVYADNYTLEVRYLFTSYITEVNVASDNVQNIGLPAPHLMELLSATVIAVISAIILAFERRRTKLYPLGFDHLNELTYGGLQQSCFVLITGNSGSGKTVLLSSLAAAHLRTNGSIYIANTDYPANIRESLMSLGLVEDHARGLIFIDAYSAVGGTESKERHHVSSLSDLTNLGLEISRCLDETGRFADIYLDSLNPLLTSLRTEYVLNFLQSMAAKVKANGGKFCVTIGTGIEKADMAKLEEAADCIIETQLQDEKHGQSRRMRIKKLRGQSYIDKWTRFRVERKKGIIFLSREKPRTAPS